MYHLLFVKVVTVYLPDWIHEKHILFPTPVPSASTPHNYLSTNQFTKQNCFRSTFYSILIVQRVTSYIIIKSTIGKFQFWLTMFIRMYPFNEKSNEF